MPTWLNSLLVLFANNGLQPAVKTSLGRSVAFLLLALASCGPKSPAHESGSSDAKALYRQHCVVCHGADGTLALHGAADLSKSQLSLEERVHQIAKGKNTMPSFGAVLKEEEILSVAQYIETFRK